MAVIHVLDKHTAELIAAGEVVERPASVVKELMENSIDAGATAVTVSIRSGGVSSIEISDNGSGIDAEFIPTAFIRHATSKIEKADDLDSIHTLGFRGEALASIASVSRVSLLTKTEADEFACLYRINGGEEQDAQAAARPIGTTIAVEQLFYNTPARMKFLKKDVSEGNFVSEVVSHIALSHPEISIKFIREGKMVFSTPGDGSLRAAAYAVLSRDFAKNMAEVLYDENSYKVSGLITTPKDCRASRSMQYFFINGRYVKNRTMMAAIEAAFKGTLMVGRFPGCVLSLQMPAELVDVNVHPAKTEVRFANEKAVFDAVYKAVKDVLAAPKNTEREFTFKPAPQPLMQPDAQPVQQREFARPAPQPILNAQPFVPKQTVQAESIKPYNEMIKTLASEAVPYKKAEPVSVIEEDEAPQPVYQPVPEPVQMAIESEEEIKAEESLKYIGEVFSTYIVAQRGDDICFIDKHAAHERAIYEKIAASYGNVSSQLLLCPVTVQLSAEEKNAVLQNMELLADSGIEVDDFGAGSVAVRAVPADVDQGDVENLIIELAAQLCENQKSAVSEKTQWVLHSISCRAAVKGGQRTSDMQLISLANDVIDGKIPPFCPHGRPCVLKVTKKELEKQFGRQG